MISQGLQTFVKANNTSEVQRHEEEKEEQEDEWKRCRVQVLVRAQRGDG